MKKLNVFSLLALIGIGLDGSTLTGLPITTQKPRPSKYPPNHPVAIELMERAIDKRERKSIKAWNDNLSRNENYYRA